MAGHGHAQRLLHGDVGGPTDTYVLPKVCQHQCTHLRPLWMHYNGQKSRVECKLLKDSPSKLGFISTLLGQLLPL